MYENSLEQTSSVTWTEHTSALANGGVAVTSVEVADIDGDGDLDVLAAVNNDDKVRVWLNQDSSPGAWSFAGSIAVDDRTITDDDTSDASTQPAGTARYLAAVDLDADGDLDIVATTGSFISWYENDCTPAPTATPSAAPTLSLEPTVSFQPTPGPTITFKPTHLPTERPTMKQFHCA